VESTLKLHPLTDRIIASKEDIQNDTDKLVRFLSLYCKAHHGDSDKDSFLFDYKRMPVLVKSGPELCSECTRLLRHAIVMRVLCPLDPKPKCRKCPQHCYLPEYKEKMEKVMRYSGPRSLFTRG
jgi:hypothetical protein